MISQEMKKEFKPIDTWATWGVIVWTLLGIYGLISLISNIIKWL